jgi:hypothetical protein
MRATLRCSRLPIHATLSTAFAVALTAVASTASATSLAPPAGLRWGASPQEVQKGLAGAFTFVGPTTPPDPDQFLYEERYTGDVLGLTSDHVAPMFYAGRLFSVAVSYSPSQTSAATRVWEALVEKLTSQYGQPAAKTKPMQLLSFQAVLRLLPDSANKTQLMTLYTAADGDRAASTYMILDLEVQVGSWIPEATWRFDNGATVKAVMRASAPGTNGLRALKPAVIYTRQDLLQ